MSKVALSVLGGTDSVSTGRQDQRRRATEEKLLAAGLLELTDSPRSELTVRGVALRAEVSPANAYKYFSSKNALIAAIYLDLLRDLPLRTDVNDTTKARVLATMTDMATVVADKPELAVACAAALIANEAVVEPFRVQIADEVSRRIAASLGPGWDHSVCETVKLTFFGALIAARFERFGQVAANLEAAVNLILGEPDS